MIDFNELWSSLDWIILVVYFVAVLGVGFVMHSRASKSFKSFFRSFAPADHSRPHWRRHGRVV